MAVAANYVVVMDGKKRLKSGDSFNVSCPVPDNFAANWAPVLTFMVDLVGSVDEFKFQVDLFPSTGGMVTVYKATYSGRHYHSVQEVLPANLLSEDIFSLTFMAEMEKSTLATLLSGYA